jgi:tetraacyldisaccharide 4'-kinase
MNLPPLVRLLLWPVSVLYGLAARVRVKLYEKGVFKTKRLRKPVISVGNLTVGGTGKTPMVIWLAERLMAEGKRVGILSRGYKGRGGSSDEIELMKVRLKDNVRFGVGANRYEQGKRLEADVDVFVLDDGFQHLRLARDVNILLFDGAKKLKQQWLLPSGELREPLSEVRRADMLVITRKAEHLTIEAQDSHSYNIFYAQTQLLGFRTLSTLNDEKYLTEIGPGPFYAFCGIGNPKAFLNDLKRWHVPVCGHAFFGDHHRYDARDRRELVVAAQASNAIGLVTTEKDWMNWGSTEPTALPLYISVITLSVRSESEFEACLERTLNRGTRLHETES